MRGKRHDRSRVPHRGRIIPARAGQTFRRSHRSGTRPDHPRACGANAVDVDGFVVHAGSSPRVRGKLYTHAVHVHAARIIPARAGQTVELLEAKAPRTDHPRACGANPSDRGSRVWCPGSSPRVRGKHGYRLGHLGHGRIIPARAGQTAAHVYDIRKGADHPRACGANHDVDIPQQRDTGSSPRVRGKPTIVNQSFTKSRIIPARAGQTRPLAVCSTVVADHPRACGANDVSPRDGGASDGSSPRVRGKLEHAVGDTAQIRIIPARAGQTSGWRGSRRFRPDHPRACGANDAMLRLISRPLGSSPRVRGKHHRYARLRVHERIIPARAGQTSQPLRPLGFRPDHPRACGANICSPLATASSAGSSPRVRGKPGDAGHRLGDGRIIPARAGQTIRPSPMTVRPQDHPRACGANLAHAFGNLFAIGSSPRVRGKLPGW